MTPHISVGSFAALIAFASARYGWGVGADEAATLASPVLVAGAGLAHILTGPGLIPAVKRGIFGPEA